MMVHIWRNHSFFRIQFCKFIEHLCAFLFRHRSCKDHPYLICVINLSFITTYKQPCFFIQKIFSGRFCFLFGFFCQFFCFGSITKDFCDFLHFLCAVDINTLHSCLFVQAFGPVNESPETFTVFHKIFFVKLLACDLNLAICTFT